MKKLTKHIALSLLCFWLLPVHAFAKELIPVGEVIGLALRDDTVTIAAFDETLGSAAKAAGVEIGDQILSIDGKVVQSTEDVRIALEQSDGTNHSGWAKTGAVFAAGHNRCGYSDLL